MLVSIDIRPMAFTSSRGASPGERPASFGCRTGSPWRPDGTVVVADRENSRLQFFSPDGQFLEEWTDVARPCQVVVDAGGRVYVAELGFRAGMWPGTTAPTPGRDRGTDQRLRLRTAGCSPAGAAGRTRVHPATSTRPTISASIRGATSTSAR